MRTSQPTLILGLCLSLVAGHVGALDTDELIAARQGAMKLNAVYMDILGDMVKGQRPYNRKQAQAAADNLRALASLQQGALWRPGTSNADRGLAELTRARPELWQNRREVTELDNELSAAVEQLAKNAGWSLDTMEESFRDVASVCRSCHKKFREKPSSSQ